jgi:hypothetical protein
MHVLPREIVPSKRLDSKILSIRGVQRKKSRWGHVVAYWTGKREFAHFHKENELDIRVTKSALKKTLGAGIDPHVTLRPGPSDWITVELRGQKDEDAAFRLVKIAWRNNRIDRH